MSSHFHTVVDLEDAHHRVCISDSLATETMSWRTPFRNTTAQPRYLHDLTRRSPLNGAGAGPAGPCCSRPRGDRRGSSENNLEPELLTDYIYAIATRFHGAALCTEVPNGPTPRLLQNGGSPTPPVPNSDCPPTWSKSKIFGFTSAP
jgi:hypothetical protein